MVEEENPHVRDMREHIDALRESCPSAGQLGGGTMWGDGRLRASLYRHESIDVAYDTMKGYLFYDTEVALDDDSVKFVIENAPFILLLVKRMMQVGSVMWALYVIGALVAADGSPYFLLSRHVVWWPIRVLLACLTRLDVVITGSYAGVCRVLVELVELAGIHVENAVVAILDALLDGYWFSLFADVTILVLSWWWGPGVRWQEKPLHEAIVSAFDRYRANKRSGTAWFVLYFYMAFARNVVVTRWKT
jgi:hypothetical protein